ncbi:MAG TPA: PQQ-dependent sugar dehydrogenase [Candidatus Limnocylindria bacterium]
MTPPSRRRPTPRRLAVAAVLALLATACGTQSPTASPSSGPTVTEPSPAPSPTPEPTPPPLRSGPDRLGLELVTGTFTLPTGVTNAGDGSRRLFVVERGGRIWIVNRDGTVAPMPFLDIASRIVSSGEQGLLGLAFHPRYAETGRFFVAYTRQPDGADVVAEYRVSSAADTADPASERILLAIPDPAANHNGGALVFGPDRLLYIALGDGGGQNDQFGNAQNLNSLLGKILRIDVNAPRSSGRVYAIPADNPFASGGGAPEIWAIGMRNPWRISFDRAWHDLYIGDVGGGNWEEIDRQPAEAAGGLNYGWPIMEGRHCLAGSCTMTGYVQPIAEYSHDLGCSVIGGYVYRGAVQPELQGVYVFGDWCSGRIFTLDVDGETITPKTVLESGLQVSSFGEDEAGEIYLVDFAGGGLYRIVVPG